MLETTKYFDEMTDKGPIISSHVSLPGTRFRTEVNLRGVTVDDSENESSI